MSSLTLQGHRWHTPTARFRVDRGEHMKPSFWFGAALAAFFIFRGRAQAGQAAQIDQIAAQGVFEAEPDLPLAEFTNVPVLPDVAYQGDYQDVADMGHFSIEEFTASKTAAAQGIDNSLPVQLLDNARQTLAMLERIRAHLSYIAQTDVPILIQSGYRSLPLNAAVGGAARSDHVQALAADWVAPTFGTAAEVAAALAPVVDDLGIGQLINEYPGPRGWVHTSSRVPDNLNNRIITINRTGVHPGIVT